MAKLVPYNAIENRKLVGMDTIKVIILYYFFYDNLITIVMNNKL